MLKDLFQFLEKLLNYITEATSVIRVNRTLWISHVKLALKNLLNAYNAKVQTYNKLQQAEKYLAVSKSQSLCFSGKLSNRKFMEFILFMLDIVNPLTIFGKISQDRNISCKSVKDSWQKCLIKVNMLINMWNMLFLLKSFSSWFFLICPGRNIFENLENSGKLHYQTFTLVVTQ